MTDYDDNTFENEIDDIGYAGFKDQMEDWQKYGARYQKEQGEKAHKESLKRRMPLEQAAQLKAARELGITPQEFAEAVGSVDPKQAELDYLEDVKAHLIKQYHRAKGPQPRPRDEQGRFMPTRQAQTQQPQQTQGQSQSTLEKMKEKAKGGWLDSQDELDLIDSLFPDPL
jgi:hypothetical protein